MYGRNLRFVTKDNVSMVYSTIVNAEPIDGEWSEFENSLHTAELVEVD